MTEGWWRTAFHKAEKHWPCLIHQETTLFILRIIWTCTSYPWQFVDLRTIIRCFIWYIIVYTHDFDTNGGPAYLIAYIWMFGQSENNPSSTRCRFTACQPRPVYGRWLLIVAEIRMTNLCLWITEASAGVDVKSVCFLTPDTIAVFVGSQ
jgi:hypothetical protein